MFRNNIGVLKKNDYLIIYRTIGFCLRNSIRCLSMYSTVNGWKIIKKVDRSFINFKFLVKEFSFRNILIITLF